MRLKLFLRPCKHGLDFWVTLQSKFENVWQGVSEIDSNSKEDLIISFCLLDQHELFFHGRRDSGPYWEHINHPNSESELVLFVKFGEL